MHTQSCNKIQTTDQTAELLEVIDLAREGHRPSQELVRVFFQNLRVILEPFGKDIFEAAEKFVETME